MSVIEDARALLAQFDRSPWRELHVRTAAGEYFLAKPGGGPNPMRAASAASVASMPAAELVTVAAPHVATLVEIVPSGTRVAAGETVATIEVLGERIAVASATAAVVRDAVAVDGALLDYGEAIVRLEALQAG